MSNVTGVKPSFPFGPSLHPVSRASSLLRPLLTSRSASRRRPFRHKARSPQVRRAPLHRTTAGSTPLRLGHESFAVSGPLALLGSALYPVPVRRLAVYAPRFLPTVGHPSAVALRFTRRDQLVAGLPPAGVRPCWAHTQKGPLRAPSRMLASARERNENDRLSGRDTPCRSLPPRRETRHRGSSRAAPRQPPRLHRERCRCRTAGRGRSGRRPRSCRRSPCR